MLTREELNKIKNRYLGFDYIPHETYLKIMISHREALDEISRLTAELAVVHDILRDKENPQEDCSTKFYVDRTKPLVQDTGNLLIPKNEEGSVKA